MALLVLDTASARCGVLLRRVGMRDVIVAEDIGRGHDQRLPVLVRDALHTADMAPAELTRVAAVTGPGSFTGVRVAVAFARGLAAALDIEAVGVNVLDALAEETAGVPGVVVAGVDIRREEVVWRAYRNSNPEGPARRDTITDARARIGATYPEGVRGMVGSAAALLQPGSAPALVYPSLGAFANLAARAEPSGAPVRPDYHRPPDAEPARPAFKP